MWARVSSAVVAALLVVVLAGCGDDESPDTKPSDAPSSTASSASPSESVSPSVEPAKGPLIEINALRFRLFDRKNWNIVRAGTTAGGNLDTDEGLFQVAGGGLKSNPTDLDIRATNLEEIKSDEAPAPKRVENRVINGVECFVLEATDDRYRAYVVGGQNAGYNFDIEFLVPVDFPDGDELLESMLASVVWK